MKKHPGPSRTPSPELAVIDSKDWWYHAGQEFSVARQGGGGGICPSGDIWRCLEMFLIISRVERVQLASNWERLINILHAQGSTLQQRIIWHLMSLVPGEQTLP